MKQDVHCPTVAARQMGPRMPAIEAFGDGEGAGEIPKYRIPEEEHDPAFVKRLIHDELELNRKPGLNLATFVTTWMDEEADKLARESIDVNLADQSIYPMTTEIHRRIIHMESEMLHAEPLPEDPPAGSGREEKKKERPFIGTCTVGSSGAVMLGLIAHKQRWLDWYDDPDTPRPEAGRVPNLVIGGSYQVCWEKIYRFLDVAGLDGYKDKGDQEIRYDPDLPLRERCRIIPLEEGRRVVTAKAIRDYFESGGIDDNTIAIGLAMGTTLTGEVDEVAKINAVVKEKNDERQAQGRYRIPIHVDAAYSGFILPFTEPDSESGLKWDFRLSEVQSINISNHKFGLVYPGLGSVLFRNADVVPKSLFSDVNYLGETIHDYGLSFSRGSWQVICQYYNFLRLGREGYGKIMRRIMKTANHVANKIDDDYRSYFELFSTHQRVDNRIELLLPNVVFQVKENDVFKASELTARLSQDGWTVPDYTLPKNLTNVRVIRMVVKENFSMDMAELFLESLRRAIEEFEEKRKPKPPDLVSAAARPAHVSNVPC